MTDMQAQPADPFSNEALGGELVEAKEGAGLFAAGMTLGQLAKTIAYSGCFGDKANPYVVATKILAGRDIGIGPIEAMRGLHVFEGKIELGSAIMASKIKGSGFFDYEIQRCDDEGCVITCFEKSHRTGEWKELPSISFLQADAQQAGLLSKKGPWQTYPSDMYFSRCMSRFFRRYCAHLAGGAVYGDGEIQEEEGESPPDPARVVQEPASVPGPPNTQEASKGDEGGNVGPVDPISTAASGPISDSAESPAETSGKGEPDVNPVSPEESLEHPYGRFMADTATLKGEILKADGGDESRYRLVFITRDMENRASVGKGDTAKQREILLALHEALAEAIREHRDEAGHKPGDEVPQNGNVNMDPAATVPGEGATPAAVNAAGELPFA
jgi:hypothetical protein